MPLAALAPSGTSIAAVDHGGRGSGTATGRQAPSPVSGCLGQRNPTTSCRAMRMAIVS